MSEKNENLTSQSNNNNNSFFCSIINILSRLLFQTQSNVDIEPSKDEEPHINNNISTTATTIPIIQQRENDQDFALRILQQLKNTEIPK